MANFKRKCQTHLCQLVLIYVITFKSIILETDQRKTTPREFNFGGAAKISIYSLLSIMLHITPWTLMLMLHIRQSIYLVLTNVLSASFLIVYITFDEISLQFQSTNISLLHMYQAHLSLPELYRQLQNTACTILVKIDVLNKCGAMICSYFGIVFVYLLWR